MCAQKVFQLFISRKLVLLVKKTRKRDGMDTHMPGKFCLGHMGIGHKYFCACDNIHDHILANMHLYDKTNLLDSLFHIF